MCVRERTATFRREGCDKREGKSQCEINKWRDVTRIKMGGGKKIESKNREIKRKEKPAVKQKAIATWYDKVMTLCDDRFMFCMQNNVFRSRLALG